MIEKHIVTTATPETIFQIFEDVEGWKTWDPDTKASRLSAGLTLGSRGHLTPTRGNTIPIEVTLIEKNQYFTLTSKTALFRLDFDHELTLTESGTRIVHRVKFGGLLKPLLTLMLGRQIEKGLPVTLQRLKMLAESMGK